MDDVRKLKQRIRSLESERNELRKSCTINQENNEKTDLEDTINGNNKKMFWWKVVYAVIMLVVVVLSEKIIIPCIIASVSDKHVLDFLDSLFHAGRKAELLEYLNEKFNREFDVIKDVGVDASGNLIFSVNYAFPGTISVPKYLKGISPFLWDKFGTLISVDIITILTMITVYVQKRKQKANKKKIWSIGVVLILVGIGSVFIAALFTVLCLWLLCLNWGAGELFIKLVRYICMFFCMYSLVNIIPVGKKSENICLRH